MAKSKMRTPKEAADLLDTAADRIEAGERWSGGLARLTSDAAEVLLGLDHRDGLKLLLRIDQLLLMEAGATARLPDRYRKPIEDLEPLDRVADAAALRSLAKELRGETSD